MEKNIDTPDFVVLDVLFEIHRELLTSVQRNSFRYLYDKMNWNNRLIILTGLRGVGKSTMLLQYAQEQEEQGRKALYISADNSIVNALGLFDLGMSFSKEGGEILLVDEVHKYPDWTQEIKNLYDSFPKLQIVASGISSLVLKTGQYDLSKRSVLYELSGLSFREFLKLVHSIDIPKRTLADILKNHQKIAQEVKKAIESKQKKIVMLFREYLQSGYFPYILEGKSEYGNKLRNALAKVLYEDIPSVFHIPQSTIPELHKLIALVASSHSFTPNISKISSQLGLAKESVYNFFEYLEQSKVFLSLSGSKTGIKRARKPRKIFLSNPNLYFAIEGHDVWKTNIGSIRESFAVSQLSESHRVQDIGIGDFLVNGTYLLEIGGKNKGSQQIRAQRNAYLIKDDIETGSQKSIPLYLLGFLY